MTKKYTRWTEELIVKYIKNEGYIFISFESKFKGKKTDIKIWCGNINHKPYKIKFSSFLDNKSRCRECSVDRKRMTHDDFIKNFYKKNDNANNIEILSIYNGNKNKLICRCKIDGIIWFPTGGNLLSNHGCPSCGLKKLSNLFLKSHEQFVNEMTIINPQIEIIERYKGSHEYIKCKCLIDGEEFFGTPTNLLQGKCGCPKCNTSRGERSLQNILRELGVDFEAEYVFDDCIFKKNLPFDCYLPYYNCCIEYDGEYHYKMIAGFDEFVKRKINDTVKTKYCQDNNIKLIRIPYWEEKNIKNILMKELNLK